MKQQRLKFTMLIAIALVIIMGVIAVPAFAVPANPDIIAINSVKVFQNVFVDDDILILADGNIHYNTTYPTQLPSDLFMFSLYNTAGTTNIATVAVNHYSWDVYGIYFTPAQVISMSIVWGTAYKVRLQGNAAIFGTLTEGVNQVTTTLSPLSNYIDSASIADTSANLYTYGMEIGQDLQIGLSVTIIVVTSDGNVINKTGRNYFILAVPGLDSAVPQLFQLSSTQMQATQQSFTNSYQDQLTVENQLGVSIKNAFINFDKYWLGMTGDTTGQMGAALWAVLLCLLVISIVFLYTGNTTIGLVAGIPMIILGMWVGAFPVSIIYLIAAVIVVYLGYFLFLRGM